MKKLWNILVAAVSTIGKFVMYVFIWLMLALVSNIYVEILGLLLLVASCLGGLFKKQNKGEYPWKSC